eukprot:2651014-Prymnesium_polylepis.1
MQVLRTLFVDEFGQEAVADDDEDDRDDDDDDGAPKDEEADADGGGASGAPATYGGGRILRARAARVAAPRALPRPSHRVTVGLVASLRCRSPHGTALTGKAAIKQAEYDASGERRTGGGAADGAAADAPFSPTKPQK